MKYENLLQKIAQSPSINIGDILSKSIELLKKVWVEALKHSLVNLLIIVPFFLIVYFPIFPLIINNANHPYQNTDVASLYNLWTIIAWAIVVFLLSFFLQPVFYSIMGNFYKVCKKEDGIIDNNENPNYFYLLKTHFLKLFLINLATIGIAIIAIILCYFPLFYVLVPLTILLPFFVFNENLTVKQLITMAFKFGNKHWLNLFLLILISNLISSVGLLFCFVGIFVTAFFQHIVLYFIYKDTIGFSEKSEQ